MTSNYKDTTSSVYHSSANEFATIDDFPSQLMKMSTDTPTPVTREYITNTLPINSSNIEVQKVDSYIPNDQPSSNYH